MVGPYPVENIKRLCVFMFQTWDNSQLLRRVLWISAELTIVSSLKHKNTQPLYIFNKVSVLHLERLKEGTWLHSFACNYSSPTVCFMLTKGTFSILASDNIFCVGNVNVTSSSHCITAHCVNLTNGIFCHCNWFLFSLMLLIPLGKYWDLSMT